MKTVRWEYTSENKVRIYDVRNGDTLAVVDSYHDAHLWCSDNGVIAVP
jgi:hypothetical protein